MDKKELKKLLIDLEITQQDVAKKLGVTRQAVNNEIQKGNQSIRIREYLIKLSHQKNMEAHHENQKNHTLQP